MPLVIHPRVRKTVGRIAALTCVAVFVSSGAAFAAQCPTQSAKQKFSKWGDSSSYFLVPGGSFEGTPAQVGWTLSGATLTPGNEPFHINGATDDQSLVIGGGASATSPAFCVDSTMPSIRFFVRQTAPGSDLKLQGVVQTPRGPLSMTVADLPDGSLSIVDAGAGHRRDQPDPEGLLDRGGHALPRPRLRELADRRRLRRPVPRRLSRRPTRTAARG